MAITSVATEIAPLFDGFTSWRRHPARLRLAVVRDRSPLLSKVQPMYLFVEIDSILFEESQVGL
jgi:hypothetical protein